MVAASVVPFQHNKKVMTLHCQKLIFQKEVFIFTIVKKPSKQINRYIELRQQYPLWRPFRKKTPQGGSVMQNVSCCFNLLNLVLRFLK